MLQPLGNRIMVKIKHEAKGETKIGNIILSDTASTQELEFEIEAIGTAMEVDVNVGDKVLLSKYEGEEVVHEGQEYKIFNAKDIIAILSRASKPKKPKSKKPKTSKAKK